MTRRHQSRKKTGEQRGNSPCKGLPSSKDRKKSNVDKSQGMRRKGVEDEVSRAQMTRASWVRGRSLHLIPMVTESQWEILSRRGCD